MNWVFSKAKLGGSALQEQFLPLPLTTHWGVKPHEEVGGDFSHPPRHQFLLFPELLRDLSLDSRCLQVTLGA